MKKIVLVALMGLLLSGCGAKEEMSSEDFYSGKFDSIDIVEESVAEESAEEEKYYLNFTAKSVDREDVTSDILANSKLTMINVWGTFCNPCLEEMPDLGEIATSYDSAQFQMIGIVSDVTDKSKQEDIDYAKELIEETKADYLHLLNGDSLTQNLLAGVSAVPTTFFVKQDGEVLGYTVGAMDKSSWEALINDLLAEVEE
ncbi:MAG: TlpA family protein disulfide reductase [Lachnospiraceae bacterium]|nr:TlpA family protein disulfide reductase [Lachnospiraceae bacterium]